MPIVEYVCRKPLIEKDGAECGHEQTELRGSQVAGGNDPVVCESCGSGEKMETQVSPISWINMKGRQEMKKGWN